jgi:hypothetical protein
VGIATVIHKNLSQFSGFLKITMKIIVFYPDGKMPIVDIAQQPNIRFGIGMLSLKDRKR